MYIFPDHAPEVASRQAAFTAVKRLLKDAPGLKFWLRFPAKLWITFKGEEHSFLDPELAMSFVKENILSNGNEGLSGNAILIKVIL